MNPACELCRGACCESIVLKAPPAGDPGRWLAYHADSLPDGSLEIQSRCTRLSGCGACMIHASRPAQCREFPVGGPDCRATVARRRPAQAAAILALMP